jgi:hypothetical protein
MSEFKTKKAARENETVTEPMMSRLIKDFLPTEGAESIKVKGEYFYNENQCEPLLTKKALKEMGLKVTEDAEPATWKYYRSIKTRHPFIGNRMLRFK